MILQQLTLVNYRNIAECELTLSPKINCFIGNNGMGKTNILDAVYYLSFCKSQLNPIDNQTIRHDEEFFMIRGLYSHGAEQELISCSVKRRRKKQFLRNKKEYERLSDHIGLIPLVLSSPSDTALIDDGSDERRRFVDMAIAQYDKGYLETLIRYNHVLQNRNALLKAEQADEAMFDVLEAQMQLYAQPIFEKRSAFVEAFKPVFQRFYKAISHDNEQVSLDYVSHLQRDNTLEMQLKAARERDKILGYSTNGIHKDDLTMLLDAYPIKRVGSQGQNKTYLIALRLAQFHFLKTQGTRTPLLLLDDLFDKLDAQRVRNIIEIVSSAEFGQIFITDTNREHLDEVLRNVAADAAIFEVVDGVVTQI